MQVRTYRKIHRYLGIVIGVQLLLWTGSGLLFSLNPIDKVRGETEQTIPPLLSTNQPIASPQSAIDALRADDPSIRIRSVVLRPHLDSAVYEIEYRLGDSTQWALADAATGRLRPPVDRDEAVEIARRDFALAAGIKSVESVTGVDADSEYRGGPLPAFRVVFDHPIGTRLYVSAGKGTVTARRNDRWRLFDFVWMLHIMDYQARDDFNTVWLQVVSALGLLTVVSGFVLAGVTSPRIRRWFAGKA